MFCQHQPDAEGGVKLLQKVGGGEQAGLYYDLKGFARGSAISPRVARISAMPLSLRRGDRQIETDAS